MANVVLIQTYGPIDELRGQDGLFPCPADLAARLVREQRAEFVNRRAEAFRYMPGTRAYEAMRASRGQAGPLTLPPDAVDQAALFTAAAAAPRRGRPPRRTEPGA